MVAAEEVSVSIAAAGRLGGCAEVAARFIATHRFRSRIHVTGRAALKNPADRVRVVIAEDFVLIQENIRKVVQQHCEVVAAVEDGASALAAVETHSPDVLLLDVSLPGISGFDVLDQLMKTNSRTAVILLTAHGERALIDRAFELGAKGYVLKGKMLTDLPAAIREVTNGGTYISPLLARR